jgi:hypothetical protein
LLDAASESTTVLSGPPPAGTQATVILGNLCGCAQAPYTFFFDDLSLNAKSGPSEAQDRSKPERNKPVSPELLEPGWGACTNGSYWKERCREAATLRVVDRQRILAHFFSHYPGATNLQYGFGQAIIDFTDWEVSSGRVADIQGWWAAVNGMMILDVRDADRVLSEPKTRGGQLPRGVAAWVTYAQFASTDPVGPVDQSLDLAARALVHIDHELTAMGMRQQALWTAHQISLHRAVHGPLSDFVRLAYEMNPPSENLIMEMTVRNVDRAALKDDSTIPPLSSLLQFGVAAFYPQQYPADVGDALRLLGGSTVGQAALGVILGDRAEDNVGLCSTRWDVSGSATGCPLPGIEGG